MKIVHFLYSKINFIAKSQQKNYSTENKVIGNKKLFTNLLFYVKIIKHNILQL